MKYILLILLPLFVMKDQSKTTDSAPVEIIYVYDPLCGWCYGFGPVISKMEKDYADRATFRIVSGGMILGDRVQPIGHMSQYILNTIPRLEELSGQKFGEPYKAVLREGTARFSSEKPSIALEAFKMIDSLHAIDFAHEMQQQMFVKGKSYEDDSTYLELLKKYQISDSLFLENLRGAESKARAYKGFEFSSALGISGFPSVIGKKNGQYYLLSNGFQKEKELSQTIKNFLQ